MIFFGAPSAPNKYLKSIDFNAFGCSARRRRNFVWMFFSPPQAKKKWDVFFKEILNNKNTPKFIERFFEIIRTHLDLLEIFEK